VHDTLIRTIWIAFLLAGCSGGGGPATGTPSPEPDTTRTVEGRVGYVSSGPDLTDLDEHGRLLSIEGLGSSTFAAPAPRIVIEILGDDGRVIGAGTTDSTGHYSIFCNFGQNPATPVRVRSHAQSSLPFGMDLAVYPNPAATSVYSYTSDPGGTPGDNRFVVMRVDVDIPIEEGAGAFHILDVIYEGFAFGRAGLLAGALLPDLIVHWEPGNGAETVFTPGLEFATLQVAGGIPGDDSSNTDVWDDPVLMRYVGQYMLDYFLWEVRPDGIANNANLVPSAAWVEGLLDWYSCAARGSQIYWDTTGIGAAGRVTRYFDIESFFPGSLTPLGPNDPNDYQPEGVVGIASRYTVAEILWDLHDRDFNGQGNDNDGIQLDPSITLQLIDGFPAGIAYPYLYTLLDAYADSLTFSTGTINSILTGPEDQELLYPASVEAGTTWPIPISPDGSPDFPIRPPFTGTIGGEVDTLTPVPSNLDIGHETQRYFLLETIVTSNIEVTLRTDGELVVELLRVTNQTIESGTGTILAPEQSAARYIVRVRPADGADPQIAPFELDVDIRDE
jgi:hypothetical protein